MKWPTPIHHQCQKSYVCALHPRREALSSIFAPTPALQRVFKSHPVQFFLGVTHLDDATFHCADKDNFVYLIRAADALSKTKDKNWYLHPLSFYKYGSDLIRELRGLNNNCPASERVSFDEFMQSQICMLKMKTSLLKTMVNHPTLAEEPEEKTVHAV